MTDDLPFSYGDTPANPGAAPRRKCPHPRAYRHGQSDGAIVVDVCQRCGHEFAPHVTRRNTNNRKRGTSDELAVARLLGGRKVGQLGLPWDVEVPGFLRVQAKKYASWPSVNDLVKWLDAIPQGRELRAVALADCPGAGTRARRLLVLDLHEFSSWFASQGETGE